MSALPQAPPFVFKTAPFAHQLACFERSRDREAFALLAEMGTGKSKMLIDTAAWLWDQGKINSLVVVAPKGVYRNWVEQLQIHMPDFVKWRAACWSALQSSRDKAEMALLLSAPKGTLQVLLVNTEALSLKRPFDAVKKFMEARRPLFAIDESTAIKNPKAKRTKAILYLAKYAPYRRIMSGEPSPNGPLDLWSQFDFLDPTFLGYSSFYSYRNHFAKIVDKQTALDLDRTPGWRRMTVQEWLRHGIDPDIAEAVKNGAGWTYEAIAGYRNLDELKNIIAPHAFIVKKADCLDLPAKIYQTRDVELSGQQRKAYEQMREESIVEIDRALAGGVELHKDPTALDWEVLKNSQETPVVVAAETPSRFSLAEIVIVKLLRLHQITQGYLVDQDRNIVEFGDGNPRMEELLAVLEQHRGKAIVWANYRFPITQICKALAEVYGPDSVVNYYGDTKDQERQDAIRLFQDPNSKVRWFVGNQATAGYGITLTAADLVVYYSNNYDLEKRVQSEDRAHRIGSTKPVVYVDLVARGTVDQTIIDALKEKKSLAAALTVSNWRQLFA